MSEEQGEYKFIKLSNEIIMEENKELSEVEKAQAAVDHWIEKIAGHEDEIAMHQKEIHFAKKNLKVHQTALKALIQLENEMKG